MGLLVFGMRKETVVGISNGRLHTLSTMTKLVIMAWQILFVCVLVSCGAAQINWVMVEQQKSILSKISLT